MVVQRRASPPGPRGALPDEFATNSRPEELLPRERVVPDRATCRRPEPGRQRALSPRPELLTSTVLPTSTVPSARPVVLAPRVPARG